MIMPVEHSPIPTDPVPHNYPVMAARAGSGSVQAHLNLGWNLTIVKSIALLNIVCPQRNEWKVQDKAARVVQTLIELWLSQSDGPLTANIHHPGKALWCVGDIVRVKSGDSLAQLLWHNDMAVLYPMEDGELWTEERLHGVINGGCKLLGVSPGELTDESLQSQ